MNPNQRQGPPPPLRTPGAPPVAADVPVEATEPEVQQGPAPISPEMVCYRTADEVCGTCDHFGEGGACAVLGMTVEPGDGCNAWAPAEGGAGAVEPGVEGQAV